MCGIVGLFLKNRERRGELGRMLAPMLAELRDRGPDSAGFAVYGTDAPRGAFKATFFHPADGFDWSRLERLLAADWGLDGGLGVRGSHRVATLRGQPEALRRTLDEHFPGLRLMGLGERVEIFKERGLPADIIDRFALREMTGSHALGHTRMATESAVTTEHSHPFSTGLDLCLVHNGSLSNHNRWRRKLERDGIAFTTDNDSEVAAGYLTWRLGQGASLDQALEAALHDLDGFYTFAVGTKDGFAILRDAIACKPAVLAETDEWVAMGTEYRAIATLPGAESAKIWEPRPATVYAWRQ
jgi:glutamate synthase domain-containing protein 1